MRYLVKVTNVFNEKLWMQAVNQMTEDIDEDDAIDSRSYSDIYREEVDAATPEQAIEKVRADYERQGREYYSISVLHNGKQRSFTRKEIFDRAYRLFGGNN